MSIGRLKRKLFSPTFRRRPAFLAEIKTKHDDHVLVRVFRTAKKFYHPP